MFLGDPKQPPSGPPRLAAMLRRVGAGASVLAALGATQPWLQLQNPGLWHERMATRGWELPEGFTCLVASAFTVLLAALETRSVDSRRAVMPGMLVTVNIAALAMLWRCWQGPGMLRGGTAAFTPWFALALVAALVAAVAATLRFGLLRRGGWL